MLDSVSIVIGQSYNFSMVLSHAHRFCTSVNTFCIHCFFVSRVREPLWSRPPKDLFIILSLYKTTISDRIKREFGPPLPPRINDESPQKPKCAHFPHKNQNAPIFPSLKWGGGGGGGGWGGRGGLNFSSELSKIVVPRTVGLNGGVRRSRRKEGKTRGGRSLRDKWKEKKGSIPNVA